MASFENADLITAIVTPFDENNHINFKSLSRLTNHLIANGSRGFIIGGTTGETPTLSHDEKISLYTKFAEIVDGRVPIVAGTGNNNTLETAEFNAEVSHIVGINMGLVVAPYYSKPNQRGLIAHFTTVAEKSNMPIIIYNIPSRTGVKVDNETIVKLAQNPTIAGVKQCTSIEDIEYLVENTPSKFMVYTGEDEQALAARTVGGDGVISVAAHVYCTQIRAMYDALYSGDFTTAGHLQRRLTPKMKALFMFPSPSPVKAVLNAQGYKTGGCRLPILALSEIEKIQLANSMGLAGDALNNQLSTELGV